MLRESSYVELGLGPREALSMVGTAGWELTCVSGRIWLTEERGDDVWLQAGEGLKLTQPGRTVIEAAGEGASLRLRNSSAFSPAPRWGVVPGKAPLALGLPAGLAQAV